MRVVLQRTTAAEVIIDDEVKGKIGKGFVALVGITHSDTEEDIDYLVNKTANLRVFEDDKGKMNLSLKDVGGSILSISQFTLYGDCRKGRRPNFMDAAKPEFAEKMYDQWNRKLRSEGITVETGQFGAMMDVAFTNNGPVTILLDTADR